MHVDIKEEPQFNEDFDVDFDQSEYHISKSCLTPSILEIICVKDVGAKVVCPPVDLHWFFEISISAIISNWDKNSVIN